MDTTAPFPPLMVAEGYDLTFFRSQDALRAELEPWFVEEDYRAWDALGRPPELVTVESRGSGMFDRLRGGASDVEARLGRDAVERGDECAVYLREWLERVGGPRLPVAASLPDLLVQGLIRGDLR